MLGARSKSAVVALRCAVPLCALASLCAVAVPIAARAGGAADLRNHARPVRSVFFVSKSENKNQVHYAVRVDKDCQPEGAQPIYGYWRDYEDGPKATSPLLSHEQTAYGVTRPRRVERSEAGGRVLFGLRGFPDRQITAQTFKVEDGGCRAWAMTTIRKQASILSSIYVELGFLFSIDYVLVRGFDLKSGKNVQEKVED